MLPNFIEKGRSRTLIRELDKPFSNGLMFPGDPSGAAAEVINCRCALLQRARWALEGSFTKMNNFTKQIEEFDSPEDYEEFKKAFFSKENRKYMNYVEQMEDKYKTKDFAKVLDKMTDREYSHHSKLLSGSPLYNKGAVSWQDSKEINLETPKTALSLAKKAKTADAIDDVSDAAKVLTNNSKRDIMSADKFTPAKTIEEAKDYAQNVLGLETTLYERMNIDVANTVNKSIKEVYNTFGDVCKAGYLKGIRVVPDDAPLNEKIVAAYSPKSKKILLRNNNVANEDSFAKMVQEAIDQYEMGFWSTNAVEHSIRHEAGHSIQCWLADNDTDKLNQLSAIRKKIAKECGISEWSEDDTAEHMQAAGKYISYYALRDDGEFISESIAEYLDGKPRETAKKVIEFILKGW